MGDVNLRGHGLANILMDAGVFAEEFAELFTEKRPYKEIIAVASYFPCLPISAVTNVVEAYRGRAERKNRKKNKIRLKCLEN